jgi:hypothetical protein
MIEDSVNSNEVYDSVPPNAQEINQGTQQQSQGSYRPQPAPNTGIGFSIASLVCGIISVLCCCTSALAFMCAVAGLVLGIYACYRGFAGKGLAIAGIVFSGIGLIFSLGVSLLYIVSSFTSVQTPSISSFGNGLYS